MLRIECPWCGVRDESEYVCAGESHIERPEPTGDASDRQWAAYLFLRVNPKGVHFERWQHRFGCRQWFNVARHTVTHEVLAVYGIDQGPPSIDSENVS